MTTGSRVGSGIKRRSIEYRPALESRSNRKPEHLVLCRLQPVVQHAPARRVPRVNQAERHIEYRHEKSNLGAGRDLERRCLADDARRDSWRVGIDDSGGAEWVFNEQRPRRWDQLLEVFLPPEVLPEIADLTG